MSPGAALLLRLRFSAEVLLIAPERFPRVSFDHVKSAPELTFFSGIDDWTKVGIRMETFVALGIPIDAVRLFES